jgi:hypothetical protein
LISRIRIASSGRDLGIQIYNQEMLEWQEHLREATEREPGERSSNSEAGPGSDFIKDALLIFNPSTRG